MDAWGGISVAHPLFLAVACVSVLVVRQRVMAVDRVTVLAVASLVFVAVSVRDVVALAALLGMGAWGYVMLRLLAHWKRAGLLWGGLGGVVALFGAAKLAVPAVAVLPGLEIPVSLGLSYAMFRLLHVMVDVHSGDLRGPIGVRAYVAWLLNFLTLLAGPVQRFEEFARDAAAPRAPVRPLRADVAMLAEGYFGFVVLSSVWYAVFAWGVARLQAASAGGAAAVYAACAALAFSGFLYTSFAGYTTVVRAFGRMLGLDLPANFDRPEETENFLGFWSRWHITLSDWFKIYVFNPLVKVLVGRFGVAVSVTSLGAAGYFGTFFLMGVWHGWSLRFAAYGLVLGTGVSVNKLYQAAMQRRLGRTRYGALCSREDYRAWSRALALGYFVAALGFFWVPADLVSSVGAAANLLLPAMSLVLGSVLALGRIAALVPKMPAGRVGLGARIALIGACLWATEGFVPPLLYSFF